MLIDSLSPLASQFQQAWLAVLSAAACLGLAAVACQDWRLHTAGARTPASLLLWLTLCLRGLGRPFQPANNTGEFKLIGSASLRQKAKKVS